MSERRAPAIDDAPIGDDELIDLLDGFGRVEKILLAVSGGPDSMALLGLAAQSSWRDRIPMIAATFDHGLRPGSADEARMVADFCRSLGVEHRTLLWSGDKPSTGLMAAARAARYQALQTLAEERGCDGIALAHHLDDQAETILMRLIAGSGIAGLAAMETESRIGADARPWPSPEPSNEDWPSRSDDVVHERILLRPFLGVPKARLVATCRVRGWPFVDDPSNNDDRFLRARLRRIAPLLAAEGLDATRLARLGVRARRVSEVADAAAHRWLKAHPPVERDGQLLVDGALFGEAEEVIIRALGLLVERAGRHLPDFPPERLERLEALAMDLRDSAETGPPLTRTFRGLLLRMGEDGRTLSLRPEPPRRRGRDHSS